MTTTIDSNERYTNIAKAKLSAEKKRYFVLINEIITQQGLTQEDASIIMGISQPRVSNITNKHFSKFTLDALLMIESRLNTRFMSEELSLASA